MKKELLRLWLAKNRIDVAIVVLLLIIAGLPRLLDLGTFLTADEKNWIGRSHEFVVAFKEFRFNDMLQTTHPGVTTMWLVGAAISMKTWLSGLPFSFQNLFHFVKISQFPIALLSTLSIPLIYWWLARLTKQRTLAFFAAGLIALDPFLIGFSRVAHVDAFLAHFLFLAALAILLYVQEGFARRWLLLSAAMSGLAVLTKAPAIFIVPYFLLVVLVHTRWPIRWSWVQERVRDFVIWLLIIAIMFVVIWPAILWVPNPEGNILVLKRDLSIAAATPHNANEDYTLNAWHYPAALLSRTTPVTLVGVVLALGFLGVRTISFLNGKRFESRNSESFYTLPATTYKLLFAYVFFFILMMTLGAKKGDRYILPVWLALDVLAAAGWLGLLQLVATRMRHQQRVLYAAGMLVASLYLGSVLYHYHPYAVAYSNPLFRDNLSQELGWGEGLDQVAAWLNANAPKAVVASWYPEELGAYTSAPVAHINAHEQGKVQYIVMYRNMFGRTPDHYANDFIDEYYKKREPVHVVKIVGKEFAWVFEKRVFERVIGELTSNVTVGQEVDMLPRQLAGVDILPATYSGKATQGELVVRLMSAENGTVAYEWKIPVKDIEDSRWRTLLLPEPQAYEGTTLYVEISATGTQEKNAPTMWYTRDHNYRPTDLKLNGETKTGDLAVRLRYVTLTGTASEEDTKILK